MSTLEDKVASDPAKILLIGKSGAGKTGSLAALCAAGYKVRIIDTDKGVKTLRSLLLDPRYPYAAYMKTTGVSLRDALDYQSIDVDLTLRGVKRKIGEKETTEMLLAPKNAGAWDKVIRLLENWKDGSVDYGHVSTWGEDCVLVIDSFSTLAKYCYYYNQALNNRLGSRDEGNTYRQDIGGAQAQLTRLLEMLYASSIKCNVIIITHITWVDESAGTARRPRDGEGETTFSSPDGFPSAIGRALSVQMGKYFNDMYLVRSSGSGSAVRRYISTVPQDGVNSKSSVYLEREYDINVGLARIFAALRGQPDPTSLITAITKAKSNAGAAPASAMG